MSAHIELFDENEGKSSNLEENAGNQKRFKFLKRKNKTD